MADVPFWGLYDWRGDEIVDEVVAASAVAIQELCWKCAADAREGHPFWETRTEQTVQSVWPKRGEKSVAIHWETRKVWGTWGVRDLPRLSGTKTTKEVALFLEFGTVRFKGVVWSPDRKVFTRPWLYPVWDANKGLLPAMVVAARSAMLGPNFRIRGAKGRFERFVSAGHFEGATPGANAISTFGG